MRIPEADSLAEIITTMKLSIVQYECNFIDQAMFLDYMIEVLNKLERYERHEYAEYAKRIRDQRKASEQAANSARPEAQDDGE